ncbi:Uncharacterised protein [Streptococcus pneumoniae]|nr:Uncharacterised protein [Streptococcus pneumoniae]CEV52858.1 Uncharacterised protein [Streptococcus pneumoniae]CEV94578.1 Uncharacterised protein [Streptococcus pneumoniae]CEW81723.1 Uncharacterised protein [Streptococcus pneumoniae]CEW93932.1 Uncharacterised protein [Streptococcus pneumoniae]
MGIYSFFVTENYFISDFFNTPYYWALTEG